MTARLQIENLSFAAHRKTLLQQISFTVCRHERVAVLGGNGSGKSTLFANVLGFVRPSAGAVHIDGKTVLNSLFLPDVSFVNAQNSLFENLTVAENIHVYCVLSAKKYRHIQSTYFTAFDVDSIVHKRVSVLSSGEARRVTLLLACIKTASILVVDEPFVNIDPLYRERLWRVMCMGKTVLFSTQNWEDIAHNATHVLVLHEGKMIAEKRPVQEFLQIIPHDRKLVVPNDEEILQYCRQQNLFHYTRDNQLFVFCDDPQAVCVSLPSLQQFSVLPKTVGDIYSYIVTR